MESSSTTLRRPCFIGEDDGLASIAEFSGNINNNSFSNYQNQPYMMRRRNSLRNISSLSTATTLTPSQPHVSSTSSYGFSAFSPRSSRVYDYSEPHFLEACALCRKPLGGNRDIFMYRGDTPFCSEECRQEQIEIDEAKEKKWNLKALRSKKDSKNSTSSSSPTKSRNYPFRTGTVAAA